LIDLANLVVKNFAVCSSPITRWSDLAFVFWKFAGIKHKLLVMRKTVLALVFAAVSCIVISASPVEPAPAIGTKIKKEWTKAGKGQLCMTHPAQLDPCFEHVFDGVQYKVAYNGQTRRVSYLSTSDSKFRTTDGLQVGSEIRVTEATVHAMPGWVVWGPTTSDGWRPIIGGFNGEVKLKDATLLKLWGQPGSGEGIAIIQGFSRGRL
jgi:hypothetical protein